LCNSFGVFLTFASIARDGGVWSLTHAFPRAKLSTEIGRVTQSVLTRCLDRYFDWVLAENRPEYASRPWAETGEG